MGYKMKRFIINIKGIVQGVGFRPFVHNLATSNNLFGWINNYPGGVNIEVEGNKTNIDVFLKKLIDEAPPLSYIEECRTEEVQPLGYKEFSIRESVNTNTHDAYISPDVSVCSDCLHEMNTSSDRRYRYPFINCTNCGPRFTITYNIPYDRVSTTMKSFEMCEKCKEEYKDTSNRRFHAQPIACPDCGPVLSILDKYGDKIECEDVVLHAVRLLKNGKILAIKGLGGYHLACDPLVKDSVKELRKRKIRDGKPFALMVKDLEIVSRYCIISDKERQILKSTKSPILLLQRREEAESELPFDDIASDNKYLGVMLPYTPLHHLLFQDGIDFLIMTSGNKSGEPIYFKDEDALAGLKEIADYFLIHNREIYIRTDDSVTSVFNEKEYLIRRSRGYVPFPVTIPINRNLKDNETKLPSILACGGELKSTFCLTKKNKAFLSHHIGDLENMETLTSFEQGITHFQKIFSVNPEIIVHDLHPEYLSTKYALETSMQKIAVQHHHAHIASCMAENTITNPVIGIAFDGTGYGSDGHIWGGEFFTGDYSGFDRAAHLKYIPMPGGEKCIKEPWRMAASYLYQNFGDDFTNLGLDFLTKIDSFKIDMLKQQMKRNINTYLTSSMGRFFDAVSSMMGLCSVIAYEGQAAIKLENTACFGDLRPYPYDFEQENKTIIINPANIIKCIAEDVIKGTNLSCISGRFHITLVKMTVNICRILRTETGINEVVLSGGVFHNRILLENVVTELKTEGFHVHTHSVVPTNDGGISLGQAAIALWKLINNKS